ncbi:MAG: hypothetical protein WDM79_14820 [Terricaulis sp.]
MIAKVERVFAAVAALLVFTLNEMRLVNMSPRQMEGGFPHGVFLRAFGQPQEVFLSSADVAIRWGLVGVIIALCVWALAETLVPPKPAPKSAR